MTLPTMRKIVLRSFLLCGIFIFLFPFLSLNLGRITLYNHAFPGRARLPYGDNPEQAYNLSLFDLDAMVAAHEVSAEPGRDEYRVFLIGDSALWGWLLHPEETLTGQLNAAAMTTCDGRRVRAYNLGYPTISLMKDLLILDQVKQFQPDLVVWLFTLEAFPMDKQLSPPLVANNADRVESMITEYNLPLDHASQDLVHPSFWDRTIIGQRRELADLARLQLYGVLWAGTGIDQFYPETYEPAQVDFDQETNFHGLAEGKLTESDLAFPLLEAGQKIAGDVPLVLINEPMLVSSGQNSNLRYNYYSPRWAYDLYRRLLAQKANLGDWEYLDLWDLVPAAEFTNTPFHMTVKGESLLAQRVQSMLQQAVCP